MIVQKVNGIITSLVIQLRNVARPVYVQILLTPTDLLTLHTSLIEYICLVFKVVSIPI